MKIDPEMTAVYKAANNEAEGKSYPITSEKIFRAMRAAIEHDRIQRKSVSSEEIPKSKLPTE